MTQLELHKKIREVLQKNPQDVKKEEILELMPRGNFDAKNYFFAQADERWIDWLWDNGFLTEAITKRSEDPTRYSYKSPELRYLIRMAEKKPAKVIEIITKTKNTATTKDNFNPEVVGQFLRICSKLPANELAIVVPKIKEENWVRLMGVFNQWGFEYGEMFKKLFEAKEYETLLDLADVVLSIKTKEEYKKEKRKFSKSPFYFNDFSDIKVFDYLTKIEDEDYAKQALFLLTKKLEEIVRLTSEKSKDKVFRYYDGYLLLDVDFFSLELSNERYHSGYENIKDLVATIKALVQRLISNRCNKPREARNLYKKYIGDFDDPKACLPDSHAMWHLRLFVLSLCPKVFKNELKKAFFRLFEVKNNYYEIISGAEYLKALRVGFSVLSESDRHDYVKRVINCFARKNQKKKSEKENLYSEYGSRILSVLAEAKQLTNNEVKEAKKKGLIIKPNYQPEPPIKIESGTVIPRAPISYEDFRKIEVPIITEKLCNEWSPKALYEKYKDKSDIDHPISAEGVGRYIKRNIPERVQSYIDNAVKFFDRKTLDSHYTYSFLLGIWDYIHNNREKGVDINWKGLIDFLVAIKESGENKLFENRKRENESFGIWWLANWAAVHSEIADVVQELLSEKDNSIIIDFSQYRNQLFEIIRYLLNYPDPTPKDEQIKTAAIKTKSVSDSDYIVSDPFTMAINTVRGRAFQAFVLFVYQDGKELEKEKKKIKIKKDVKEVYEEVLSKENTRALMFMFGHYLPSFYFRDKDWIRRLLPKIFPKEPEKKNLYTAAWEGYLSTDLYKQMFFDPDIRKLYEKGLQLTDKDYPKQKHFKDPDEALADHLALAFVHFPEFDFKCPLFNKFWKKRNIKRHKEFILFIGRYAISRGTPNEWMKYNNVSKEKLKEFWNWVLKRIPSSENSPEILSGFGFWINPKEEVLGNDFVVKKMAQTIEKSAGKIDWDYGLSKRLSAFAEVSPENTLKIIKNYLLGKDNNLNPNRYIPPVHEGEIKNALEIIYGNGSKEIKQEVTQLVNTLIKKGSSMFWDLEGIINE